MPQIASGDRGDVEQDKQPSQQQAAPGEVPETGTTRMHEMVLTQSRTKESHVAGEQLRRSCNAGPLPNVTRQEGLDISTPPTEEAHSDDSSSGQLDPNDQPGPSWASGQSVPLTQAQPTTDLPPFGNTSTAPTQQAHTSVPRTRQSAVCPPLQGTQDNQPPQQQQGSGGSGSVHTVQGTEAQEHRGTGRAAVRQGVDRPREPTLHEALSSIMGAYHHSQETMAMVLAKFQETQRLQEEQYLASEPSAPPWAPL
ncbi:hypothetical protein NDU88_003193 [Pleurodeles waltl]|uniref:Uncharacterized protein n=1 Tax=Pleurodeles waltl TaxID=8319 RepID=A0AAV7PD40_PLEWA|nr:hypothetical protein NDU88_003193 [Pleurodeles waltl]